MNDLYATDVVAWSERQAALLRRIAAGERVNSAVDWANVIEEIRSVGRSEREAVLSALEVAMKRKLCLLSWPEAQAHCNWEHEVRIQLARAAERYRRSMRREIMKQFPTRFRLARLETERHMLDDGPPVVVLPGTCPWTLDELLAEGRTMLETPPPWERRNA